MSDLVNTGNPIVQIFYQKDVPVFICGFNGNPCGVIEWLEKDFIDNPWEEATHGDGIYTYSAKYQAAETGEFGMIEFPEHWELDLISFSNEQLITAKAPCY